MSNGALRRRRFIQAAVEDETPVPGISIALSQSALSAAEGGSDSHEVTLTRVGGFSDPVDIGVSGLPTGVTATYSDSTLSGAETTCVITYTAASGAPAIVGDPITVSATGTGVSDSQAATITVIAAGSVAPFFSDDFAGLQKNDSNGFTWGSVVNDVSVVSFDGYECLRFNYVPTQSNVEQRFNLGRYLNAVWVEYWIHIPANFLMPVNGNNKFFTMWRDTYSDYIGGTQGILQEYQNYSGASSTEGRGRNSFRRPSGTGANTITDIIGDSSNNNVLIGGSGPLAIGEWGRVRYAMKGSSAFGMSDGYFKSQFNSTTYANNINQPMHNYYASPADVLFRNGYFMGWANSRNTSPTSFHIREVKFYDTDPGWVF